MIIRCRLSGHKEASRCDMLHLSGILETDLTWILLKTRLLFFNFLSKPKGDPLSYLSDKTVMSLGPESVPDYGEIWQSV